MVKPLEYLYTIKCCIANNVHYVLPMYFRCRPSMDKFIELIKCKRLLRQLSVYIHKAFLIRTETVYMIQ